MLTNLDQLNFIHILFVSQIEIELENAKEDFVRIG